VLAEEGPGFLARGAANIVPPLLVALPLLLPFWLLLPLLLLRALLQERCSDTSAGRRTMEIDDIAARQIDGRPSAAPKRGRLRQG
jgi:hypothetical protein